MVISRCLLIFQLIHRIESFAILVILVWLTNFFWHTVYQLISGLLTLTKRRTGQLTGEVGGRASGLIAIWVPKCLLVMMRTLWVLLTKICSVQFVIWLCENRFSPDVATDSVGNVSTDTWRGLSLLFIFENNVFSLLGSFPLKCLNRYKISSKLCLCRKLINLYRGKCSRNVG